MMKRFMCDFSFPDLPSGKMYATEIGEGGDVGNAVNDAFKKVKKRPAIKGRRIKTVKISVTFMDDSGKDVS